MAVNTPSGLSERQVLKNIVLQVDTLGSIQVDSIGKECASSGYGYLYKDNLQVSLLGLVQVDNTIGMTEAGFKAQQMNAFLGTAKQAPPGLTPSVPPLSVPPLSVPCPSS